jgi:hypothetical protein
VSRRALLWSLGAVVSGALVYWIASNTYWGETTVPMPLRGEAATNPYYAAQRFVSAIGARASRDRLLDTSNPSAVIVLSNWNWNLSTRRRQSLEAWVEAGGRLVVDDSVAVGDEFTRWSGIALNERPRSSLQVDGLEGPCFRFTEQRADRRQRPPGRVHWVCEVNYGVTLSTTRAVDWALDEAKLGRQALRVRIGRGSVTMINAQPFRFRGLLEGDHGWLLAAAAQLRRGDEVSFLSEAEYPSLLAIVWQTGAPVVVLGLTVLGLSLWRGGVRIGPLAPADVPLRRSLAEQIRGTARFAFQHDGGEPLHAASARALEEVARRRITGYGALAPRDRVRALSELARVPPAALDLALHDSRERSPHELRDTIALLETTRRALVRQKRTGHGIR